MLVKWLFAGVLLGRSRSLSGDGDRSKSALSSLYGTPHWWPDEEDYAAKIDSSSHYYNSDPVKRRWSSGLGMSCSLPIKLRSSGVLLLCTIVMRRDYV